MIIETFPVGPLQCNCTILGDELGGEAIVIDPGDEVGRIHRRITELGLKLKQILVTHAHIDHIAGAHRLKELTGAPILYNQLDLPQVRMMDIQAGWLGVPTPKVSAPDEDLQDGKTISIVGLSGTVIHTPGHTHGSSCLYLPDQTLLIAGDTLFAGSIGRTDLPGGNTQQILKSIHDRLLPLPDDVKVIPGHGSNTTIGMEREENPFLQNK
jgi:glyoxylase-like metal-dependent hydrolase (beta-lactamase superfamily II)